MKENEIFPTPSELFDDTDEELTATDTVVYVVLLIYLGMNPLTDSSNAVEIAQEATISFRTGQACFQEIVR